MSEETSEYEEQEEGFNGDIHIDIEALAAMIAQAMIEYGKDNTADEFTPVAKPGSMDWLYGEMARCTALKEIYLSREEYEKCAVLNVRLDHLMLQMKDPNTPQS